MTGDYKLVSPKLWRIKSECNRMNTRVSNLQKLAKRSGGMKTFSLLKDIGIRSGNRSSCVGTMNLPSRSIRRRLVRTLPLWLEVQNGVGTT